MTTPSSAAVRQRRLRERRRRGTRIVSVEADVDLIADLELLGLIGPGDRGNPDALSFALMLLLSDAIESRIKMRHAQRFAPGAVVESPDFETRSSR